MSLQSHLVIRIVFVAALCLAGTALAALWSDDDGLRGEAVRIADSVGRQLEIQLLSIGRRDGEAPFTAQLDPIADGLLPAGFCATWRPASAVTPQTSCRGAEGIEAVPPWFAHLFASIFGPDLAVERQLDGRHRSSGLLVVDVSNDRRLAQGWHDVRTLIAFAAVVVAASSLLVYLVVARALRPATEVLAGIERLERGDLQSRLRSFGPIEFRRISVGFNRMASALEAMTRERSELTARLMNAGETERHRLARELHDELGQCITAVNAIASGVTQVAEERCPELVAEGERLARTGSHMMTMLRGMLRRLRPVALEELGFTACIRALVAEFRCTGTQVELSIGDGVDDLRDDVVLSGYRVVQECLTNVARHARATRVAISIATSRTGRRDERSDLEIRVEDDGIAGAAGTALQPGMGLLGMKERVAAIGGRLEFAMRAPRGFSVVAHLPMTGGLAQT